MSQSRFQTTMVPAIGSIVASSGALACGLDGWLLVLSGAVGATLAVVVISLFTSDTASGNTLTRRPPNRTNDSVDDAAEPLLGMSTVLDAVPIGILLVGVEQRVVAANAKMREVFTLPETPGYPVETVRAQRLLRAIEQTSQTGDAAQFEMTLSRRSDVELKVHVIALKPDPPAGLRLMIAVEDITQSRLADAVHRDFVANASHELKTPLAVVSGLIETLQGPARNDPAGTERFLNRLASQTRRMTRLIDDLMSLNRIEINERVMPQAPHELTALIGEAVDALRPAAETSDVTLLFDPGDLDVTVLADREELGQLFGNLIDNAIKYGGSGGMVRIDVGRSDSSDEVAVSVADTGPGIAREHLPRLTERFYRVDIGRSREQGGTGLGLAICKHIVNRHRGRIEIESVVTKGTTFTVHLPCSPAKTAPEVSEPNPSS